MVFCKKGKNSHRKWGSLFFNEVAGLRPITLLKKRFGRMYFPVNFLKFSARFFYRTTPVGCFFYKCEELDENQQGVYDFKNVTDCEVQIFSILIVILRSSLKIGKDREMFWSK